MSKPDSLFAAAKKVAEIADLEWPEVHKVYRALQQEPDTFLPKSSGRNVWYASPNFITRLLIALAAARHPDEARKVVSWVRTLKPRGIPHAQAETDLSALEQELFPYLVDAEKAADLESVEVHSDTRRVVVNTRSKGATFFYTDPAASVDAPAPVSFIYARGVIVGEVFQKIAQNISWRLIDGPPFTKGGEGDVDPEAGAIS